ncbi:aminopeptidase P family protein [Tianweitania sp. BSSL-BM11]|uniref:Aminopeptidase P family protein n=1 Tax=Tianweitania aestuarii TaxID=2814886 RepID=A0ABS5RVA2_9HYPH|nr:aminopeptidase P family protein [Tianweitania aestuarii]MBS9720907.1 aminopeptidase P family protein [Tianweitania aestuarii]
MFQSFESLTDPSQGRERVAKLRRLMQERGVDGFLVPRADEHQGEYVPPRAERLQWLTGFTGSAGIALILKNSAVIFVDGRYTLQVRNQADPQTFTYESLVDAPPPVWIEQNLERGTRLAFEPWLHTVAEVRALRQAVEQRGASLIAVDNLVDLIWDDQPEPPLGRIAIQPEAYAGELAKDKLPRLAARMHDTNIDATVLTDPSSVAWAFNIRGSDVLHTPLALSFAILPAQGLPQLFIDERKLDIETRAYLTQLCDLHAPADLEAALGRVAKDAIVGLDFVLAAEKLRLIVEDNGGRVVPLSDPARLPRATKNAAELEGSRAAHRRDGAAMVNFLHWVSQQQGGTVDEITTVEKLEAFRRTAGDEAQMPLRDISFDTISGSGPNGALMHYRVTRKTNRVLAQNELYLVDSGAQYQDGTTDITRTTIIGTPNDDMKRHYTIVLKGLINISLLRFPAGTRGCDIDAVARVNHWKAGLDFAHGTGHGVGSYLAVHEGPQRIAKTGTEKLLPGMILSNEPGYYKPGSYGIRLENLIVVEHAADVDGGDIPMHSFETLTLCPFERQLIDVNLLSPEERDWLDTYHAWVQRELGSLVSGDAATWLIEKTQPLEG